MVSGVAAVAAVVKEGFAESARQIGELARSVSDQVTKADLEPIKKQIDSLERRVGRRRLDVKKDDETRRRNFISHAKHGACPGCGSQQILNSTKSFGTKEGICEWDHEDGNTENNDESNMWPLCPTCHKAKTEGGQKDYFRAQFTVHMADFRRWLKSADPWASATQERLR